MNKKVLERALPIMEKHTNVLADFEEFNKLYLRFNERYLILYDVMQELGHEVAEILKKKKMTDDETDECKEFGELADVFVPYGHKMNRSVKKYGVIAKQLNDAVGEFELIRDRINLANLENAHAIKLLDNFAKALAEKHTNYFEYKKEFEIFENELTEIEKRFGSDSE